MGPPYPELCICKFNQPDYVVLEYVFSEKNLYISGQAQLQTCVIQGSDGGSVVKNPPADAGDMLDPWVGKIPWRRKWQPTLVFLPGKSRIERESWWTTVPGVTRESDTT